MSVPTQEEINNVINWCMSSENEGYTHYPGMTYEQGVRAAIDWMEGGGEDPTE